MNFRGDVWKQLDAAKDIELHPRRQKAAELCSWK